MSFQHDLAGGQGKLVIAELQSPNYVHGSSGWIIRKDGSAEFQDVIIPSSGGMTATFAATAPASPTTGDLWYDTSNGLLLHQWNGTTWVPYSISTGAIANNAITASQLAAGIIYAGIVNGTTITGATIVADGSSGEFLAYSGTPAAGNLIASVSPVDGTDAQGNKYYKGNCAYFWVSGVLQGVAQIADGAYKLGLPVQVQSSSPTGQPAVLGLTSAGVGGEDISLTSGLTNISDVPASIELQSQNASGLSASQLYLNAGRITLETAQGATPALHTTSNGTHFDNTVWGTGTIVPVGDHVFVYSGTPALGNLVASIVHGTSSVTDSFGNVAYPGVCQYHYTGSTVDSVASLQLGQLNVFTPAQFASGLQGGVFLNSRGVAGSLVFQSGLSSGTDTAGQFKADSQTNSGVTGGQVHCTGGKVQLGHTENCWWDDNAQQLLFNSGGLGPFISGEGWHAVTLASGLTGLLGSGVGVRVKLLPWNMVHVDIQCSFSMTTSSQTFNLGSLPSASYYPAVTRHLPLVLTGAPTGIGSNMPRLFVPTSGGLQILVPSGTAASGINIGGSYAFPTN